MSKILFRASSVGNLLVGGNKITSKQLQQLNKLQNRKSVAAEGGEVKGVKVKPLTAKQEEKLSELINKRTAPFILSQTAKSYIEAVWLRKEFGYDEPVFTDILMKGLLCEQDGIKLVSNIHPSDEFRIKNKIRFTNQWFSGCPDLVLNSEKVVEDIKNCWTIKQFIKKKKVEPLYYCQLQVYMHLTGLKNARLHYCLVDTPEEIILEEEKRFYFKFGCDEDNKHYIDACNKIRRNHKVSHIPENKRLKTFEFDYDEVFIEELKNRVDHARIYYQSLAF